MDAGLECHPPSTDEVIVSEVMGGELQEESDDDDSEDENYVQQVSVSNQEARDVMDILDRFLLQRGSTERDMNVHRQEAI